MESLSFFDTNLIYNTLIASGLGGLVFLAHGFFLNSYLRNQNMFLTAFILPPIALVITTAIATSFYLALGMIGALSIIRYRTPVKSQYDLALLFALITIGVVGGVNMPSALWIAIFLILLAPIFKLVMALLPKSWLRNDAGEERGYNRLMVTLKGDLNENINLLDLGGKLVSVDINAIGENKETSIHMQFPSIEKCIEAKKHMDENAEVLTVSMS